MSDKPDQHPRSPRTNRGGMLPGAKIRSSMIGNYKFEQQTESETERRNVNDKPSWLKSNMERDDESRVHESCHNVDRTERMDEISDEPNYEPSWFGNNGQISRIKRQQNNNPRERKPHKAHTSPRPTKDNAEGYNVGVKDIDYRCGHIPERLSPLEPREECDRKPFHLLYNETRPNIGHKANCTFNTMAQQSNSQFLQSLNSRSPIAQQLKQPITRKREEPKSYHQPFWLGTNSHSTETSTISAQNNNRQKSFSIKANHSASVVYSQPLQSIAESATVDARIQQAEEDSVGGSPALVRKGNERRTVQKEPKSPVSSHFNTSISHRTDAVKFPIVTNVGELKSFSVSFRDKTTVFGFPLSHLLTLELSDTTVTGLSQQISTNWDVFAIHDLGLRVVDVDHIKHDHLTLAMCITRVFTLFRQKYPKRANLGFILQQMRSSENLYYDEEGIRHVIKEALDSKLPTLITSLRSGDQ